MFRYNTTNVYGVFTQNNEIIQNPAKKFYEATRKLNDWVLENGIQHTKGLESFITHYNNESYPGLGSVKKLSLMHHLELIGKYLDEVH